MDFSKTLLVFASALAILAGGCQHTALSETAAVSIAVEVPQRAEVIGGSAHGRPIELFTMGSGAEVVLMMASIHGNEPAGEPLLRELMAHLQNRPQLLEGKTVLFLPVANPDGLAAGTRYNANGVDLNRNFPTGNRVDNEHNGTGGLNEPESRVLYELIRSRRPQRIISIHQPLACIDYDGPAEAIARTMAENCDLPVNKLGGRPGSLGSWAGIEMRIPIVTMELLKSDTNLSSDQLWDKYGKALLSAI